MRKERKRAKKDEKKAPKKLYNETETIKKNEELYLCPFHNKSPIITINLYDLICRKQNNDEKKKRKLIIEKNQ